MPVLCLKMRLVKAHWDLKPRSLGTQLRRSHHNMIILFTYHKKKNFKFLKLVTFKTETPLLVNRNYHQALEDATYKLSKATHVRSLHQNSHRPTNKTLFLWLKVLKMLTRQPELRHLHQNVNTIAKEARFSTDQSLLNNLEWCQL